MSLLQNGDISYHLHKVRTFSPFAASEWHLSDGSKTSPGTIIIRKSPFAGHVTFERKDGTLVADMGPRLLMTGSEFCWGGKVYRYHVACFVHAVLCKDQDNGLPQGSRHLADQSRPWPLVKASSLCSLMSGVIADGKRQVCLSLSRCVSWRWALVRKWPTCRAPGSGLGV